MNSFYESVALHDFEDRALAPGEAPKSVVLHFSPRPSEDMSVACLWSHWHEPNKRELYSFAAITDDPPPEIAAAGHNRCVIPLKPQNVDAWLTAHKPHSDRATTPAG